MLQLSLFGPIIPEQGLHGDPNGNHVAFVEHVLGMGRRSEQRSKGKCYGFLSGKCDSLRYIQVTPMERPEDQPATVLGFHERNKRDFLPCSTALRINGKGLPLQPIHMRPRKQPLYSHLSWAGACSLKHISLLEMPYTSRACGRG